MMSKETNAFARQIKSNNNGQHNLHNILSMLHPFLVSVLILYSLKTQES